MTKEESYSRIGGIATKKTKPIAYSCTISPKPATKPLS